MKATTLRITLLAGLGIVLASSIAVGATYSLWDQEVSVENHLSSGNLSVKLERTNLVKHSLNAQGYLEDTTNSTLVDFTNSSTTQSNIFDLNENELVVPGSYYDATLKLTNSGSVAIGYTISLKFDSDTSIDLASQIKIYVDDQVIDYLYTDSNNGEIKIVSSSMDLSNKEKSIDVKIEFENLESNINNLAQDKEASFDLIVKAVQKIEK